MWSSFLAVTMYIFDAYVVLFFRVILGPVETRVSRWVLLFFFYIDNQGTLFLI